MPAMWLKAMLAASGAGAYLLLHRVSSCDRPGFSSIVVITLWPCTGMLMVFMSLPFCSFLFLWLAEAGKYETIIRLLKQAVPSQPLLKHGSMWTHPILHVLLYSPELPLQYLSVDKIQMAARWNAVILCLQSGFRLIDANFRSLILVFRQSDWLYWITWRKINVSFRYWCHSCFELSFLKC